MRSFAPLSVLASLLVKDVYAAAIPAVITDVVIVTEEIIVTKKLDGSYQTGDGNPVGTTIISGSAPVVLSTSSFSSSSSSLVSTSSVAAAAVFVESNNNAAAVAVPSPSTSVYVEPTPIYVAPTPATTVVPTTIATSTSAAPVASSTRAVSSSSGAKRGIAFNDASFLSAFTGSSSFSWSYNWGSATSETAGFEYVPLLWGLSSEFTGYWAKNAQAALDAGSKCLVAFNEPDYSGQANLGYEEAATGYMTHMQPFASKARLGSPSVTNGGGEMGLTYLSNFINACDAKGCTVDFVCIHWYDGGDADAFKEYIGKAYTAGGNRPIWLTEFEAPGSNDAEKAAFLAEILPWLDAQDTVERYAYFMASEGSLITSGALSVLGKAFASLT